MAIAISSGGIGSRSASAAAAAKLPANEPVARSSSTRTTTVFAAMSPSRRPSFETIAQIPPAM